MLSDWDIAREFADRVGSEIIKQELSPKVIKLTGEILLEDYAQIEEIAKEKINE